MGLIMGYKIKDIKEYEFKTGKNILKMFEQMRFSDALDLISLGNGGCGIEKAADILDNYLKEHTYIEAIIEIRNALIGDSGETDGHDKMDITKFNSLTDLYIHFNMQLMSIGLDYNAFWSMTTKEMYKVFDSIKIKMQNDINRDLQNYHTLAAMVGTAVWGKLDKKAPQVNLTDNKYSGDVEGMDPDDAIMVAKLKSIFNRYEGGKH